MIGVLLHLLPLYPIIHMLKLRKRSMDIYTLLLSILGIFLELLDNL